MLEFSLGVMSCHMNTAPDYIDIHILLASFSTLILTLEFSAILPAHGSKLANEVLIQIYLAYYDSPTTMECFLCTSS